MKYKDFIKLPPEAQEAYWQAAQAAAQKKRPSATNA